jgi:hypothetical protein
MQPTRIFSQSLGTLWRLLVLCICDSLYLPLEISTYNIPIIREVLTSVPRWIYLRSSMDSRSLRFGVRSQKLSNVGQSLDGWPNIYYLEFLRASEGTLSRWSRLHLQLMLQNVSLLNLHNEGFIGGSKQPMRVCA